MSASATSSPPLAVPWRAAANPWLIALAVMAAVFMVVLDSTVVNVALPHIQRALTFSGSGLEWVVTAYSLAFGSLLLLGGRLGDIYGRRRVFIAGIVIFSLGSFAGGLASISSELNALGSTMAVDFYRNLWRPDATDAHYVSASKGFTALWGLIALGFAFCFRFADNLIQVVNIVGSIFYGPVLGLFVVAFFFKRISGSAAFWGAVIAQALVTVQVFGVVLE